MKHFKIRKKEERKKYKIIENIQSLSKPRIPFYFFKKVRKIQRYVEENFNIN
jgi:hypothetical protein